MNYLALDIGLKRTGVALADNHVQVPVSLDTIVHDGMEELVLRTVSLVAEKKVQHVVLGLPYLLSGSEGEQCAVVRLFASQLHEKNIPYSFIDERCTSRARNVDSDASAAVQILGTFFDQMTSFKKIKE